MERSISGPAGTVMLHLKSDSNRVLESGSGADPRGREQGREASPGTRREEGGLGAGLQP